MLGQVVVNDQGVHSVIHKPLAHRCSSEWSQILIGRGIRGGGSNHNRVRHCTLPLKHGYDAGDIGLLLTNRNVDAIERTVLLIAICLSRSVETSLADDRVDTD